MPNKHPDIEPDYSIRTINKTFEIIEIICESSNGASLAHISSSIGLSRNATFRILKTLAAKGIIEMDEHTSFYTLGFCSATLAQKMLRNMSVINYAHPVLEQLANRLDEAIYLTVPKNDEVLFLDMVDCNQQIKTAPLLGRIVPFFTNAAGKVMKCFERDIIEKVFKKRGRPKDNMPDLNALDNELAEIRQKGVAVDRGGLGEGIISVAVAIRDYSGKIIGAITLIGPAFRMLGGRLEKEIIPSMQEEALLLSGRFGYMPA